MSVEPVITPEVVLAVKLPVPLSRVARYMRGWSKDAYTQQRGDYLVIIEPPKEEEE